MSTIQNRSATQSQKLMIFVLTMSLYGLATLFTELIPKFQVGLVEFSVEYFLFIPLTLAMLFDPLSAALGAATGELVFSEIMLGQFGGLGGGQGVEQHGQSQGDEQEVLHGELHNAHLEFGDQLREQGGQPVQRHGQDKDH